MAATRTQIYLTADQRARLDEIREREGKTLAQVVRDAVDRYLEDERPNLAEALEATAGILPDLEVPSRDEWDRGYG
jgi:predicted DNA-binding protein